jgi:hypothetical protein
MNTKRFFKTEIKQQKIPNKSENIKNHDFISISENVEFQHILIQFL